MADYDGNALPFVPQLSVEDIVREVAQTERDFAFYLFPAIRRHAKSPAERRHIAEVRAQLYERSAGQCEMRVSPKCLGWITFETMHTCHVISRARSGPWDLANLKAGCAECHIGWEHNGGKPCPPK
jgi:hypothetical protein